MQYHNKTLHLEKMQLEEIAREYGTPCYVYSKAAINANWRAFHHGLSEQPHQIHYAVKANSNLSILKQLVKLGSGFDIVSLGELKRALAAGGQPSHVIFSGVGKSSHEIEEALKHQIHCFNVESMSELKRINDLANQLNITAPISLRVNPDINPETHSYISTGLKDNKFGIDSQDILPIAKTLWQFPSVRLIGLSCHIGSQMTSLAPVRKITHQLIDLFHRLQALQIDLEHLNIGGGLGIAYPGEKPPTIQDYTACLIEEFNSLPIKVFIEPGRAIVGNAGCLLTRVEYIKKSHGKHFAIVDAGMNDLIRPALYHAWHTILPVTEQTGRAQHYDVVGPVCESADFLGKDQQLIINEGDVLAIDMTGAYGFSMSSNYNSRCRAAEVMVDGNTAQLIRRRETYDDLLRGQA